MSSPVHHSEIYKWINTLSPRFDGTIKKTRWTDCIQNTVVFPGKNQHVEQWKLIYIYDMHIYIYFYIYTHIFFMDVEKTKILDTQYSNKYWKTHKHCLYTVYVCIIKWKSPKKTKPKWNGNMFRAFRICTSRWVYAYIYIHTNPKYTCENPTKIDNYKACEPQGRV